MTRVFQPIALHQGDIIHLDDKASHYIARVLRSVIGEQITLFNGQGGEFPATITHITKKTVTVELSARIAREVEAPIKLHLAQGIAKGEKMDFIVQKAVELGVTHITPLITERCNVRLDSERETKRHHHWQAVAASACEQSGRNHLPDITAPVELREWLADIKADLAFVLSPHVDSKLPKDIPPNLQSVVLLIGPEGGLSQQEVNLAMQQGFKALNLGPRVLRTETATIAALATLQYVFGDLG